LEEAPKGQVSRRPGRNSQAKGLQSHGILERSKILAWTPKGINPEIFRDNLSGKKTGGGHLRFDVSPPFYFK
jgi:hypothetical protein